MQNIGNAGLNIANQLQELPSHKKILQSLVNSFAKMQGAPPERRMDISGRDQESYFRADHSQQACAALIRVGLDQACELASKMEPYERKQFLEDIKSCINRSPETIKQSCFEHFNCKLQQSVNAAIKNVAMRLIEEGHGGADEERALEGPGRFQRALSRGLSSIKEHAAPSPSTEELNKTCQKLIDKFNQVLPSYGLESFERPPRYLEVHAPPYQDPSN